jgi:hypothetical protein
MHVHCPLDLCPGPRHVTLVVALDRVLRLAGEDSSIPAAAAAIDGSGAFKAVLSCRRRSSCPGCQIGEPGLENDCVSLAPLHHCKDIERLKSKTEEDHCSLLPFVVALWRYNNHELSAFVK